MTSDAGPAGPPRHRPAGGPGRRPQARFESLPGDRGQPGTVRAVGDIDLTNAGQFEAALDRAAAGSGSGAVTADMTAVTYCDSAAIRALLVAAGKAPLTILVGATGPVTGTLLEVSGLGKTATVVTLE